MCNLQDCSQTLLLEPAQTQAMLTHSTVHLGSATAADDVLPQHSARVVCVSMQFHISCCILALYCYVSCLSMT